MKSPFFNPEELELFINSVQDYIEINDLQMLYAMLCAFLAHGNQRDKEGEPYFLHPIHVAKNVETRDEKMVALLHDVLEDSGITEENLQMMGFSEEIISAVKALTRGRFQSYSEYIKQVRKNPLARKVKLADIQDNMNPNRLKKLNALTQRRLKNKYENAIHILR